MEEVLGYFTRYAVFFIDAVATLFLCIGTLQVLFDGLRVMLVRSTPNHDKRVVWIHFSQWLIAALSIQLAADVVETSLAPTWEEIGKLGAIAVIRTFLNYFLGLDMKEIRERDRKSKEVSETVLTTNRTSTDGVAL